MEVDTACTSSNGAFGGSLDISPLRGGMNFIILLLILLLLVLLWGQTK